jgi:UDP-N-acetylmuramate dehydrogenase
MDKQIQQFEKLLGKKVKISEQLAKHTIYKIGGPAKYFIAANNNEDLVRAITFSRKLKIPYYLLAGGSNILISDQGFSGLIILIKTKDIIFKKDNLVVADAGVILMELINKTVKKGLVGLENLAGIPGTVGGAIRGNAGAFGGEIADHLTGVEIMRGGKQFILTREQCNFCYRDSIFKHNNDLVISAEFKLQAGDSKQSQAKIKEILAKRRAGQPWQYGSAGSVFKNVLLDSETLKQAAMITNLPAEYFEYKKIPAAWLIEQCGLKGQKIGDAQISKQHANFIVNLGQAKAVDVIGLIQEIKRKVKVKFNFNLETEIQLVGF